MKTDPNSPAYFRALYHAYSLVLDPKEFSDAQLYKDKENITNGIKEQILRLEQIAEVQDPLAVLDTYIRFKELYKDIEARVQGIELQLRVRVPDKEKDLYAVLRQNLHTLLGDECYENIEEVQNPYQLAHLQHLSDLYVRAINSDYMQRVAIKERIRLEGKRVLQELNDPISPNFAPGEESEHFKKIAKTLYTTLHQRTQI